MDWRVVSKLSLNYSYNILEPAAEIYISECMYNADEEQILKLQLTI